MVREPDVQAPAPHGASPQGPVGGAEGPFDFVPTNIEWRTVALDTVRRYPLPCLALAAAVGFWIGRNRGKVIAAAVGGLATNAVMKELNRVFDSEGGF